MLEEVDVLLLEGRVSEDHPQVFIVQDRAIEHDLVFVLALCQRCRDTVLRSEASIFVGECPASDEAFEHVPGRGPVASSCSVPLPQAATAVVVWIV